MTNLFLKAKHWQLFSMLIGLPILGYMIMFALLFSYATTTNDLDDTTLKSFTVIIPAIVILVMSILFGWFWSIAIGLQSKIPPTVKMKVNKFKVFFFIPIVYIFSVLVFMTLFGLSDFELNSDFNSVLPVGLLAIMLPLHFLSMFGIFYSLYFVAKTYKTAELQREVSFSDFAGEFFMIWFYPVGIWFIQPKINEMVEGTPPIEVQYI
ncbi:hypothetical protein AWW67_00685 [Roseivirga seohaensis]|uniref:Uncharacterized protein n=2 Tax=Roseivirga seohaensis TaxID=1914963 RepID=A0A0L8AK65_9BACT|nr:hypothetical protein [Roseivirga seohaensis]KOF02784.1 hypothetical protein OB69_10815 [Roseivirga seohaensis subsp. aquiponti]KYG85786.1 hypothetical protein AWW67_00685 [Roseivirga seohaensis]